MVLRVGPGQSVTEGSDVQRGSSKFFVTEDLQGENTFLPLENKAKQVFLRNDTRARGQTRVFKEMTLDPRKPSFMLARPTRQSKGQHLSISLQGLARIVKVSDGFRGMRGLARLYEDSMSLLPTPRTMVSRIY